MLGVHRPAEELEAIVRDLPHLYVVDDSLASDPASVQSVDLVAGRELRSCIFDANVAQHAGVRVLFRAAVLTARRDALDVAPARRPCSVAEIRRRVAEQEITPPQSPGRRSPGGSLTREWPMGRSAEPSAMRRARGWTTRADFVSTSPRRVVPFSMVRVTPGRTTTLNLRR